MTAMRSTTLTLSKAAVCTLVRCRCADGPQALVVNDDSLRSMDGGIAGEPFRLGQPLDIPGGLPAAITAAAWEPTTCSVYLALGDSTIRRLDASNQLTLLAGSPGKPGTDDGEGHAATFTTIERYIQLTQPAMGKPIRKLSELKNSTPTSKAAL
jgi:hypothetical protein